MSIFQRELTHVGREWKKTDGRRAILNTPDLYGGPSPIELVKAIHIAQQTFKICSHF